VLSRLGSYQADFAAQTLDSNTAPGAKGLHGLLD
jgi:hypothetical protein